MVNTLFKRFAFTLKTIYLTDDAFSAKAKCFNKMFTSILVLFFLLSCGITLSKINFRLRNH